jgi:dipeptidyl aminopeptidase/acylaminoacyl peptidase
LDGSSSLFAFGPEPGSAAFVNESLTRPPEIFVRSGEGKPAWQLTRLNSQIATGAFVKASEVTWQSADGTNASGWLMVPAQTGQHGPWPMVTMVHGGPTFPFPDAFAPYFYYWPFPLDAYVAHGMAVFVPNYRGTSTFGRKYQSPDDWARVPADDIISGVKQLIAAGVADPERLGISGQSYGAWLGPHALTRLPIFKASSFAEGTSNQAANYELQDGLSNREMGDVENRANLYDAPQRYLDLSPDLHFATVRSANLFEAGAWSQALEMLGFAKVSRHFGLPTEYVIYPRTAHNPTSLLIQRESAVRNLDWFRFWLKGEGDPDPAKAEQYSRWNRLRNERATGPRKTAAPAGEAASEK